MTRPGLARLISIDLGTAELAKVSANAFLATKISFTNAMADLCDAAGVDSPALVVATALHAAGARVRVHDPRAGGNAREAAPQLDHVADAEKAAEDADIVLHLTEWRQYQQIDLLALGAFAGRPVLIDARNALPHRLWREAGWTIRCMGTGHGPTVAAGDGAAGHNYDEEEMCGSW